MFIPSECGALKCCYGEVTRCYSKVAYCYGDSLYEFLQSSTGCRCRAFMTTTVSLSALDRYAMENMRSPAECTCNTATTNLLTQLNSIIIDSCMEYMEHQSVASIRYI